MSRKQIMQEIIEDRVKALQKKAEEPEPVDEDSEERQSGALTEEEAKQVLIDRALEQGDAETAAAIKAEDTETFYQRWLRYVEEEEAKNRRRAMATSGRAGPSDATRKKLREKRKKKK